MALRSLVLIIVTIALFIAVIIIIGGFRDVLFR